MRTELRLLRALAANQLKKYQKAQRHSWTRHEHDGTMLVMPNLLQTLLSFVLCGRITLGPQRQCEGYVPCNWNVAQAGLELGLFMRRDDGIVDSEHILYAEGKFVDAHVPYRLEVKRGIFVRVPIQLIIDTVDEYSFLFYVEGLQNAEQHIWSGR